MSDPSFQEPGTVEPPAEPTPPAVEPPTEPAKTTFKVGEREYDVESAQVKIENADRHIKTLETENAEYKQKLVELEQKVGKSETLDTLMERIQSLRSESKGEEVDIDTLVQQAANTVKQELSIERQQELETKNFNEVKLALADKFGDKADEVAFAKAAEFGYTKQEAVDLAKRKPKAFMSLVLGKQVSFDPPPTPSSERTTTVVEEEKDTKLPSLIASSTKDQVAAYQVRLEKAAKQAAG